MPFVKINGPYRLEAPYARNKVSTFTNEPNKCNSVLNIVGTRTYGQNRVDSYFTEALMVRVTIKTGYLLNEIIPMTYYMIHISPFNIYLCPTS